MIWGREPDGVLVAQLQAWAAEDPVITPLALPPIKALKATKTRSALAKQQKPPIHIVARRER